MAEMYEAKNPTGKKVIKLSAENPQNELERNSFDHLNRYIKSLNEGGLKAFLQFTTGLYGIRTKQTQPNRQKKVIIAGDSVLKHLQGHKMSRNSRVKVSSFPGCTMEDMQDFVKPVLRKKPDEIILHVGTNSLRSCDTRPRACAEEIIDLAKMVSCESPAKIALSSLLCGSDDEALASKIAEVNTILTNCYILKSWGFVDHSNISTSNLNRSGLHLGKSGTFRFAQNFINYLRLD
ncbi:uncharacterized protein LOC111326225 [Stylophora pistillata]|uniref:uncharacterized protein LOC111326225 n=1 Tax=Stylophora pistillata TaxID=50429 RepID=UPI000C052CB0|nr:uncharacterized protein LOC111326225 [Stylophora pistillata]